MGHQRITQIARSDVTNQIRRLVAYRAWLVGSVDLAAWAAGFLVGVAIGSEGGLDLSNPGRLVAFGLVVAATQLSVGRWYGLYCGRFRIGGYDEVIALGKVWTATALVTVGFGAIFSSGGSIPLSTTALRAVLALLFMTVTRFVWRALVERELRPRPDGRRRVVVLGAGEAGYLIVRGMLTDPRSRSVPVALLDDDPLKAQRSLMGVRVKGTLEDLASVVQLNQASLVVIAIPSASSALIGRVVDAANECGVEVRTLPPMSELAGDSVGLSDIRPITENDLLGRAEVHVDLDQIRRYITAKRVLVTGAGGSIGSELCRQLTTLGPSQLLMLDRDETGLHSTQLSIEGRALLDSPALIVADVRDRDRVFDIFEEWEPDVVFHAAALKHLTLLEMHPMEGVKTNVFGTRNVIDAAVKTGVECIVNISTDKAADPTSVLGATKRLAEQVAAEAALRSGERVVSVRFGNVLGSRGSVLPTFLSQIATGGPVTVTDPDVTRYFMTIPEAVRLVLQAGAIGDPGEILILDMGEPVKIADLARRLIDHHDPTVKIEYTGLRPGEKLHEILVANREVGVTRDHPRVMHTRTTLVEGLEGQLDALARMQRIGADELVGLSLADREVAT